jgi:hypothetical protein
MHIIIVLILFLGAYFGHGNASAIFACDFEDGTMCDMHNSDVPINFTVATGETLVHKALGPAFDHTLLTPSGHFLYWYRSSENLSVQVDGSVFASFPLQPNLCLNFAYYINSLSTPDNLTELSVALSGCSKRLIWSTKVIDSDGWQVVQTKLPDDTCSAMLEFFVSSNATEAVSVSVDDILIDICAITSSTTAATSTEISTSSTTTSPSIPTTKALGSCSRYSVLLFIICIFFLINQFGRFT